MAYQKKNMYYPCIACITIDSVIKINKNNYPSLFRRMQVQNKENTNV